MYVVVVVVDSDDAKNVAAALAVHLRDVSADERNFERLPDSFWGYYARGHDSRGVFGVIVMYSEDERDIDDIMRMYETWAKKKGSSKAP